MGDYAYYNGKFGKCSEINLPLTDRALYFGDGVYEVILARNDTIYQFDEHYQRLRASLGAIGANPPPTQRELKAIMYKLCDLSGYREAVIYLQISTSSPKRAHERDEGLKDNLLLTVSEYKGYDDTELSLISVEDERHGICNVKSLNLLLSVMALRRAKAEGCDGAIFVRNGIVTEEARSNISLIKDGELITHPQDKSILGGIMRDNLIRAAKKLSIPVVERCFPLSLLYDADEVIISSTTKFLKRTRCIDGKIIKQSDCERFSALKKLVLLDYFDKTRA